MKNILILLVGAIVLYFLITIPIGCNKQNDLLNAKPNVALTIPNNLSSLQSLLNNESLFNINDPALGTISSDEYYISDSRYQELSTPMEINGYIWAVDIFQGFAGDLDWVEPYQQIYYANVVLDALNNISASSSQQNQYNKIKGTALFFRSIASYNLVQTFASPYDSSYSEAKLGIPIRLTSDLNTKSIRNTEKECYDQIIKDLQLAVSLLPQKAPVFTQPSSAAANALLARIYLGMGDYKNALLYSNACLSIFNVITNYNNLTPGATSLNGSYLAEDMFHTCLVGYQILTFSREFVDSTLYASYDSNDLRRTYFFYPIATNQAKFKGSYEVNNLNLLYSGLATDEIYLIRAECEARAGDIQDAMNDLNTLLVNRYAIGKYVNRTASSVSDALYQVLQERRKELLFRGVRWTDLRRLNMDPQHENTLTRIIEGVTYTLPPNDPRYALPIPDNEISISGLQQNAR